MRNPLPSPGNAAASRSSPPNLFLRYALYLGSSEAWRTLLQTLRTRIFLSLSDDASATNRLSSMRPGCQDHTVLHPSPESAKQSEVSLLSAQAGGGHRGSIGASKSFREQREALFQPREFALLSNCQAICLPYDGAQSLCADTCLPQAALPAPDAPLLEGEGPGEDMSERPGTIETLPARPGGRAGRPGRERRS